MRNEAETTNVTPEEISTHVELYPGVINDIVEHHLALEALFLYEDQ